MVDRRRLYNDTFKEDVLRQLQLGVSVRRLSLSLRVSQVTLHKWKKESFRDPIASKPSSTAESALSSDGASELTQQKSLEDQLRVLTEERDILKKALLILIRSDRSL